MTAQDILKLVLRVKLPTTEIEKLISFLQNRLQRKKLQDLIKDVKVYERLTNMDLSTLNSLEACTESELKVKGVTHATIERLKSVGVVFKDEYF